MAQILGVALNPSIDKTLVIDRMIPGQEMRVRRVRVAAGGKGVNVVRALTALGCHARLAAIVGGAAGQQVESLLTQERLLFRAIHSVRETRTNLTLEEPRRMTRFLEPGVLVPAGVMKKFIHLYSAELKQANAVILSGSIPPGMPSGVYARLIRMAQKRHVLTVLDTSEPALKEGLKAAPFMVKPNRAEAEELLGMRCSSRIQIRKALSALSQYGSRVVLLSLGSEGLAGFDGARMFLSQAPRQEGCTVGCGDVALAAFLASFLDGENFEDCLASASACAAANVGANIPGLICRKKVARLRLKTRVEKI